MCFENLRYCCCAFGLLEIGNEWACLVVSDLFPGGIGFCPRCGIGLGNLKERKNSILFCIVPKRGTVEWMIIILHPEISIHCEREENGRNSGV